MNGLHSWIQWMPLLGGSYHYSLERRLLELAAIGGFVIGVEVLLEGVWLGVVEELAKAETKSGHPLATGCLLSALLAICGCDLFSGLAHLTADHLGSESFPVLGPAVFAPFRRHHRFPLEMTQHDFVETTGHSAVLCCLLLALRFFLSFFTSFSLLSRPWLLISDVWLAVFCTALFLTNQFHKWAHSPSAPFLVVLLQRLRLVLSPHAHALHHVPPHDRSFCITTGWLNPLLDRLGFWRCILIFAEHLGFISSPSSSSSSSPSSSLIDAEKPHPHLPSNDILTP